LTALKIPGNQLFRCAEKKRTKKSPVRKRMRRQTEYKSRHPIQQKHHDQHQLARLEKLLQTGDRHPTEEKKLKGTERSDEDRQDLSPKTLR
jgi:hypothetical protein